MKKIGGGVQYDVYDLRNGRVKKIETSFLQKIYRFHKIAPKYNVFFHLMHNIKTAIGAGEQTKESLGYLRNHLNQIDATLIGNPVITNDGYEQDAVTPLEDILYKVDFEKQKEIMNSYIENMLSGWDYGFSDTNFNFMLNSGVNHEGKVILIDLGELTWKKEIISELVRTKHWEKRSSYNKLKSVELKDYVKQQFSEKLSLSNLDYRWESKIV